MLANVRNYQRLAQHAVRLMATAPKTRHIGNPPQKTQEKSWLTRKVEASSSAMKIFLKLTNLLGYGSPKQIAGRRAFALYNKICAVQPDQDRSFWQDGVFDPALDALSFMPNSFRMPSPTNISVLVYHN